MFSFFSLPFCSSLIASTDCGQSVITDNILSESEHNQVVELQNQGVPKYQPHPEISEG